MTNIDGPCNSPWSTLISAAIAKADKRYLLFENGSIYFRVAVVETLCKSMIRPIFDFIDVLYDSCLTSESNSLKNSQHK